MRGRLSYQSSTSLSVSNTFYPLLLTLLDSCSGETLTILVLFRGVDRNLRIEFRNWISLEGYSMMPTGM